MRTTPEPRFARIASMIGDPTRARMLAVLLGGNYFAAGEIARAAGVTPQTASSHLAKLIEAEMVVVRVQGRHRYYRLADGDVAHALEALSLLAERNALSDKWSRGAYQPLKQARSCYGHIAGELGVNLLDALIAHQYITPEEGHYRLSEAGRVWLHSIGVEAEAPPQNIRRYAYPCLDWSERRDHLAGALAGALLDQFIAKGWLTRVADSRALRVTATGRKILACLFAPTSGSVVTAAEKYNAPGD